MTWSITAPALKGGKPIVRWNNIPLGLLPDPDFRAAVRAADALASDVVDSAGRTNPRNSMADEAAMILDRVMKEMDRRGVGGVPDREQPEETQNAER